MAKEEKTVADQGSGKLKKNLILAVTAILLLALGGGSAYLLTHKNSSHDADDDDETVVEKEKPKKKKSEKGEPPIYIAMDAFTVNLIPESGEQYLQVAISAEADDAYVNDSFKAHTPKLRHQIMLILSSKKASQISTNEGKEALADEIRVSINSTLGEPPRKGKKADGPIKEILFTSFIIQ